MIIELAVCANCGSDSRDIAPGGVWRSGRRSGISRCPIGLDAELTLAYFKRGALYETRREFEKALEDYNETIRLDPQLAEAYFYRARTKALQGQDIEAKQDVDRAVELGLDWAALEADIERIKSRR